tara:strand:- start:111 stop:875 length:765 start_codon:yes stop_codon:yes gene_type:complete
MKKEIRTNKMIVALMIGRAGSHGFPDKNLIKILGKHLCEYPIIAAKKTKMIDQIFVSTDCSNIKKITNKYNVTFLKRPKYLATSKALGEDVFRDAYYKIKSQVERKNKKIEMIVLLMANAGTVNSKLINKGISILRKNKKFDSAVTTSVYNMWSPIRARKLTQNGTLEPFIPFNKYPKNIDINCDRDSQGNVYYADMSVSVVRPKCLEKMEEGLLPQKWMGKKIAPIFSYAGFDLDFDWQVPILEHWIKKNANK